LLYQPAFSLFVLTGIPNVFLDVTLHDASVDLICQRTSKEHRQLAVELDLDYSFIENVVIEKPKVIDRTRVFFREWMLRNGSKATLREIGKAIVEVGMDVSIVNDCFDY